MANTIKLSYDGEFLKIDLESEADEVAVHLWRADQRTKGNLTRMYLSGWTDQKQLTVPLAMAGNYHAQMILKDGTRLESNELAVTNADFVNKAPVINDLVDANAENQELNARLMQKMYITGSEAIIACLKQKFGDRQLSVYAADFDAMRIGNMIFANEFFNGDLKVHKLVGTDVATIGYQISMMFRSQYTPLREYLSRANDQDTLLVVDAGDLSGNTQNVFKKLANQGVQILSLVDLVEEAYVNRYVVGPLADQISAGVNVLMVNFPLSKNIQNKSAGEVIASQTSIGKLRRNKLRGVFSEALNILDVDQTYKEEVLNGWELDPQPGGYDYLKDKAGTYVNIVNGQRVTHHQAEQPTGPKLYFYGNSVMYGVGTDDAHTIPSLIAQELQDADQTYDVQNRANFSMNDYVRGVNAIKAQGFQPGDTIVFGAHLQLNDVQIAQLEGHYLDLQPYYERPHDLGELFLDFTHMNRNSYVYASGIILSELKQQYHV